MLQQQADLRQKLKHDERINERRIADLYRLEESLRDQFITVNDFIRDCQDKERNAEEKCAAETVCHANIGAEIAEIQQSLQTLSVFEEKLAATVEEFRPYEEVIERVVEASELYKNVKDLIDRCDALS